MLDGFDRYTLIAVVRRQDTWLESIYHGRIMDGEQLSFQEYLDSLPADALQWDRLIDGFAERFGADAVRVLPYELLAQDAKAFLQRFVDSLGLQVGLDLEDWQGDIPRLNPALSPKGLELQRRSNPLLTDEERRRLKAFLQQAFPKPPGGSHGLLTDTGRAAILRRYRRSNEELLRKYLPPADRSVYRPAA